MTYLQLVNEVLVRLRENEVSTVTQTPYSKLIGKYVNDIKRDVEDAYDWNALTDTLTATTSASLFNYVLTGSGVRFRVLDVINDDSNWFLETTTRRWMNEQFLINTNAPGSPQYYSFNGVDSNGDTQVDLFPIPDGVYNIRFNIIKPQPALSSDNTQLLVPSEPVIFGAVAKALVERGEDQGQNSSEAYGLYRKSLGDHVAIEAARYGDETVWDAI
jgi:hypothetical protein